MTTTARPSLTDLTLRLAEIVGYMCQVVAARGARDRALVPMIWLVWHRFRRVGKQLAALMARVAAGRPARARRPAPATPRMRQERPRTLRIPDREGWMQQVMPESIPCAGMLCQLLQEPEMIALLAAEPAAVRLLRPLCRMFGVTLPAPPPAQIPPETAPTPAQPPPRAQTPADPAPPPPAQPPWRRSD